MISITDLHHDYLLISKMRVPTKRKTRLLTELLGSSDNPWRVVGITEGALSVFSQNNFIKVKRMGINRSHLVNRIDVYTHMFENVFTDANDWWDYYYENDKTVLSTSSENMSSASSNIIYFDNKDSFFKSRGFSGSYTKKEKLFLEELAKNHVQA